MDGWFHMHEALIWGASGGIGGALVRLLAEQSWKVYAAARHEHNVPAEAAAIFPFEAGDPYSVDAAALSVAQDSSGLDLVVYAAGGLVAQPLDSFDAAAWRAVIDANLNGAFLTAKASLPLLKEGGHLMLIGAYVDKIGLPRFSAYTAAKAGLASLATILQKEQRKLKVTLVRPPAVDTPFWANAPFKLPAGALTPEAVAQAVYERWQSGETGTLDL
jgi:NAD(P)-dependent dehydrogenase (short-subunit alcohol dehydrogenase family)